MKRFHDITLIHLTYWESSKFPIQDIVHIQYRVILIRWDQNIDFE